MTGKIPEQEEVLRNVPQYLRGNTKPDKAAMAAHEAGLIDSPDSASLYQKTKELSEAERPRSAASFVPEAEYNLENQKQRDAGFKPEPQSLPGMPQSEMPGSGLKGTPGVPQNAPGGLFNVKDQSALNLVSDLFKGLDEKGEIGGELDPVEQAKKEAIIKELVSRARAMGYETTQDVMLYAARNAPREIQNALRKNLAPTLSPFDDHAYKEMDAAKNGNAVAKKSMMDSAQQSYLQKKMEMVKGTYRKFKANQQIAMFKDGDEGKMILEGELFVHDNYRKFSKDELAAQRWYTEGKSPKIESLTAMGVSEDQAKKWLDLARNPTDLMKSAREATQKYEDEMYSVLSDYYDEMGYVADHVTRRWERPEQYLDWEGKTLSNKPAFSKGRKFVTQADGIDAGFKPTAFDIKDDIKAMNRTRVNVLSRIHAYQKLGAAFGPDGMPAMINEAAEGVTQARNAKLTPHNGEAPKSWLRFPGTPLLQGVAINPYYKEVTQYMMARPFNFTGMGAINFASASTKAAKLIGLFHGFTQAEMIMSGINYRNVLASVRNKIAWPEDSGTLPRPRPASMEDETMSKNPIKAVGQLYDSFMKGHAVFWLEPALWHSIWSRTISRSEV